MLVQSEFDKEFNLSTFIAIFLGFGTSFEGLMSVLRDTATPLVDLTLYMVGVMILFVYAGYQSMRNITIIPRICVVGMIGTVVTLTPSVVIALSGGLPAWEYLIIPVMPVSYAFSYLMGKEFYIAVLNEKTART